MGKAMMILLSATTLMASLVLMESGEQSLTAGAFSVMSLAAMFLYRRFSRSTDGIPSIFRATAAIGAVLGVVTIVSGAVHSAAVTAVAFSEGVWAPLTILRFTTGAMLLYAGAVSLAMHRAIRAGRRWAVGVGAAAALFFWTYLVLLLPLPGTGGTVPPMLGLWSAYLLWLGAAVMATMTRAASHSRLGLPA